MLIPPIVLGIIVLAVGLFPNLIANTLLAPIVHAIIPESMPIVNIALWHGLNAPLFMSIGVIVVGFVLYRLLARWKVVYNFFKQKWSLNRFYDLTLAHSQSLSARLMKSHMSGLLRDYLVYILSFIVLFAAVVFLQQKALALDWEALAPVTVYELFLAVTLVIAAIFIAFSNNRIAAILVLGVAGYIVALFFVNFRAPDLALTQLVIETVTVALFLLCFYHLPELRREKVKRRVRVGNLIVSISVGIAVTVIAISSFSSKMFDPISAYFVDHSYELAGGTNIVNVILVDFRGADTMLEILVLGIAALGVFGLIKLKLEGGKTGENE